MVLISVFYFNTVLCPLRDVVNYSNRVFAFCSYLLSFSKAVPLLTRQKGKSSIKCKFRVLLGVQFFSIRFR